MGIESLYNGTCDVMRRVETADGLGSVTTTWTAALTAVPCRQRTLPLGLRTQNAKMEFLETDQFWLPAELDGVLDVKLHALRVGSEIFELVSVKPARGATGVDHVQALTKQVA